MSLVFFIISFFDAALFQALEFLDFFFYFGREAEHGKHIRKCHNRKGYVHDAYSQTEGHHAGNHKCEKVEIQIVFSIFRAKKVGRAFAAIV